MTHGFDKDYWDRHWQARQEGPEGRGGGVAHPYLDREISGLVPGTALDAGCGTGAEAIWLAAHGWDVTAADISREALARAAERATAQEAYGRVTGHEVSGRATGHEVSGRVRWVEADLTAWDPGTRFDLVTTHYAHPAMPQLAFYHRIAAWVAPGGTLLIVGHLHTPGGGGHGHGHGGDGHGHPGDGHGSHPPAEATVTLPDITAGLDSATWQVVTAEEHTRTVARPGGGAVPLRDVVVRATRHR